MRAGSGGGISLPAVLDYGNHLYLTYASADPVLNHTAVICADLKAASDPDARTGATILRL